MVLLGWGFCGFGKPPETHEKHLGAMLQGINTAGLKPNLAKCRFRQVCLPGCTTLPSWLKPDPGWESAAIDALPPKEVPNTLICLGSYIMFRRFNCLNMLWPWTHYYLYFAVSEGWVLCKFNLFIYLLTPAIAAGASLWIWRYSCWNVRRQCLEGPCPYLNNPNKS